MTSHPVINKVYCSHCGELCRGEQITFSNEHFCCEGCKLVYQLLAENGLCTYYDLDSTPGKTINSSIERKRFDYLTNPEVEKKLIDFNTKDKASTTFLIPHIHCTSCVWLLENLHQLDAGVYSGSVNFLKRQVTILFNPAKTSVRNIVELLTNIGYEPDLKLEHLSEQKTSQTSRSLWLKLGVAGFSFGNIMLFSFPEYFNVFVSSESVDEFKVIFGALNIILAMPVLFYSGIDYLKSAWAALSQKGINLDVPISMGIIALVGRSLYEIISGVGPGYLDSFAGFIFFLLIGKVLQQKTFDRLSFDRDYKSYLPISVMRLIDGIENSIPVTELEVGDQILVRNNELIPSDSILTSTIALIDYSFITGEIEPVEVAKGELVFAGGKISGLNAEMMVSKKVEHSYLTQLWENEAFSSSSKDENITNFADRISPIFTLVVIAIAVISSVIWYQWDPSKAFTIFTAVLIVACPCALALSTPFTLGSATNILSLNGLYIKSTNVIEALAKTDTVVFDKTGTITESSKTAINFIGNPLTPDEESYIKSTCRTSLHPLSKMIASYYGNRQTVALSDYYEVTGKGLFSTFEGNSICIGSTSFLLEQSPGLANQIGDVSEVGTQVHVAINNQYKGYFEFKSQFREGVSELLTRFKDQFQLFLLSGDNEKEGPELESYFGGWDNMSFNQTPQDKLDFIKNLKSENKHVTMIGDGLNDAGALKYSDFGIAISDDMSSFSPACDAILEGNKLKDIDRLFHFSRTSLKIILGSFGLSLLYNTTGLAFAVTGNLSPLVAAILMPLSSISVMVFTTLTTRLMAKKLGLRIWA
ncbi:MAG: heavy metal translocating P-type ATPase [Balneolaceae bacterium]